MRFKHFLAIDWSGAKGPRQKGIALAFADGEGGPPVLIDRGRGWGREDVFALLRDDLPPDTLVGMDLGIALPFADCGAYFPGLEDSPKDAPALWALIDAVCAEDSNLEAGSFVADPRFAPYFRNGAATGLHFRCDGAEHGRGRFRVTEQAQAAMGCKPYSNFNLVGAAQVGKSSLTGMRMLHRLRGRLPVWPIDPLPDTGSVAVEIYTSLAASQDAQLRRIERGAGRIGIAASWWRRRDRRPFFRRAADRRMAAQGGRRSPSLGSGAAYARHRPHRGLDFRRAMIEGRSPRAYDASGRFSSVGRAVDL